MHNETVSIPLLNANMQIDLIVLLLQHGRHEHTLLNVHTKRKLHPMVRKKNYEIAFHLLLQKKSIEPQRRLYC